MLSTGEHFALEVRGDSMIEAGILDGDIALIKKTEGADTGDIVVALIDEEEATLKRFRRRGASIALEPANTAYEVKNPSAQPRAHPGQDGGVVPAILNLPATPELQLVLRVAAVARAAGAPTPIGGGLPARRRMAQRRGPRDGRSRRAAWG